MNLDQATAVSGGAGRWTADLAEGWDIFGITNGGYLMAIATRAMEAELDGRALISATATFLNPASAGPVDVDAKVLKRGRSLSTARVTMSRDGKDLVHVIGVFTDANRPVPDTDLVLGTPPDLPPPEECVRAEPTVDAPLPPPFSAKVDARVHPEDAKGLAGQKTGNPLIRGWFRLNDGEPLDAKAVVLATDAFPPAIFNADLTVGWTPTVDLTIQVRNPKPAGWLACRFSSRFITDGMLEEDGEIWDESGHPVALSRQLALVPR